MSGNESSQWSASSSEGTEPPFWKRRRDFLKKLSSKKSNVSLKSSAAGPSESKQRDGWSPVQQKAKLAEAPKKSWESPFRGRKSSDVNRGKSSELAKPKSSDVQRFGPSFEHEVGHQYSSSPDVDQPVLANKKGGFWSKFKLKGRTSGSRNYSSGDDNSSEGHGKYPAPIPYMMPPLPPPQQNSEMRRPSLPQFADFSEQSGGKSTGQAHYGRSQSGSTCLTPCTKQSIFIFTK